MTRRESTALRIGFLIVFVALATIAIALAQPHVGPPPVALSSPGRQALGPSPSPSKLPPIPANVFVPSSESCQVVPVCATPEQIRRAYDLDPLYARGLDGRGNTIAVVIEVGSPTIRRDLAEFDADYGIPAPPKLDVIKPVGEVPAFDPHDSRMLVAARETSLDVEWAHAMAPGASILLVLTPAWSDAYTFDNIALSERWVVDHDLADVISQSFGFSESIAPKRVMLPVVHPFHRVYEDAASHRITVVASTGDDGPARRSATTGSYVHPVVVWPASDPLVTAVGGVRVHLDAEGNRTQPDSVWNETDDPSVVKDPPKPTAGGGGLSTLYRRPTYQSRVTGVVGGARGLPDISLSASIAGGVVTFWSFPGSKPGYHIMGGTSEAAPLLAGIVAVIDQAAGRPIGELNPLLYRLAARHAPGIVDVTQGDNIVRYQDGGEIRTARGWPAVTGYDLASGLGTIDAAKLTPEIVRLVRRSG